MMKFFTEECLAALRRRLEEELQFAGGNAYCDSEYQNGRDEGKFDLARELLGIFEEYEESDRRARAAASVTIA